MGLFEAIFGGKRRPAAERAESSIWKTLTGYTPVFSSWNGQLYESELIRAAIDAIARAVSKLEVTVQGTAHPKLRAAVRGGPNPWITWPQFLYRVATILYAKNTAFIIPLRDEMGTTVGWVPILPEYVETVADQRGNPWIRFRFAEGKSAAVELGEVGILTRHQYRHDLFGESNRALDPTMNLITMQQQGIPEAIKNSATFRFMAKLTNFSKDEDLRKARDRFNREQMSSGDGGVLLFPNTWGDIRQIDPKPYTVDADQMKLIQDNVYTYFGVNEDVLQNHINQGLRRRVERFLRGVHRVGEHPAVRRDEPDDIHRPRAGRRERDLLHVEPAAVYVQPGQAERIGPDGRPRPDAGERDPRDLEPAAAPAGARRPAADPRGVLRRGEPAAG